MVFQRGLHPSLSLAVADAGIIQQDVRLDFDGHGDAADLAGGLDADMDGVGVVGGDGFSGDVIWEPDAMLDMDGCRLGAVQNGIERVDVALFDVAVADSEAENMVSDFALLVDVATDMKELSATDSVEEVAELFLRDLNADV